MTRDAIRQNLERYVNVSDEELDALYQRLEPVTISKRDILVNPGQLSDTFYWVMEGCMMAYFTDDNGFDHVMQFATSWWWTADLEAFLEGASSSYTIRCMEDAQLLALRRKDMMSLLEEFPVFEKYFRIIFQNALVAHQRRIIQNISRSAEDRYEDFLNHYAMVEQMVPQKYIASYLGITPEFLSKIRRKRVNQA